MKNRFYLFALSYFLIVNNLNAQIESTASNFIASNSKIRPLSIKPISDVKCEMSDVKYQVFPISNVKSPIDNAFKRQNSNVKFQDVKFQDAWQSSKQSKFKLIDFFQAADTFNKQRFWGFIGASTTFYVGVVLLLDKVWYAQYPRSGFHLFDDSGEWEQMDKYGHVLTAYTETKWMYQAMRWTGMENRKAAWAGMATGTVLQATLEGLDGFSTEWGFSWYRPDQWSRGFRTPRARWDRQSGLHPEWRPRSGPLPCRDDPR